MVKTYTISVPEAARRLRVSINRLYDLLWAGKLAGEKIEGRWQVSLAAVEERLKRLQTQNGK